MSELEHAKSFRELIVYQKSRLVAKQIFKITKSFPKGERYFYPVKYCGYFFSRILL